MVTWQSTPTLEVKITHSGTDYIVDAENVAIRRRENGFDTVTILLVDTDADVYVNKSANDDAITVREKDLIGGSYTTLFAGVIRERHPAKSKAGDVMCLECDGAGYPLGVTVCGKEYGKDSDNGYKTIKTITEDIIDNWVEKILGTATSSGHTVTADIEDIAGDIGYLSFPYKWNMKAINDICDYLQAIKGASAGPHWIVAPDANFLLTTVGAHAAPAVAHWPTWWRTDAAGSTLVEGLDFENFEFEVLSKEANYILYGGMWRRPGNGDAWTENTIVDNWSKDANVTIDLNSADITGGPAVGQQCNRYSVPLGEWGFAYTPSGKTADWDFTIMGRTGAPPFLNFYGAINVIGSPAALAVSINLSTDTAHVYAYNITDMLTVADKWLHFSLPVGPHYATTDETRNFVWTPITNPADWEHINWIAIYLYTYFAIGEKFYLDGLHMGGVKVLRGARPAAAYTATNPLKMKVITDDVAKDDSLLASDVTGSLARLAYAELLRCQSTPIVGTFTTPIAPDLLAGQLVHIHAKKKSNGTFAIDETTHFRVTKLIHNISKAKATTTWNVTSDVTNALARTATSDINTVLGLVRPEWQDRQASSIKGAILALDVPILEHSY